MVATITPAQAQDFSLRVVTDDRHDWTKVPSLNIIAEPGSQDYREFILTNGTNRNQSFSLDIANSKNTDGVISIDDESEASATPFITFSENPVAMRPGAVKTIRMSLKTPGGISPFTESPYLLISSGGKAPKPVADGKIKAVLPIVNRVAYPIFIGVGNYSDFETNFEIDKIGFQSTSDGNVAKLWIKNNGKLDLRISGFIKFQDAVFEGPILGPFDFKGSTVLARSSAFVSIPLPETITETKWRIFAQVESSDVIKTKIFVENVSFSGFPFLDFIILFLIFVISLLVLVWSIRQFRTKKTQAASISSQNNNDVGGGK